MKTWALKNQFNVGQCHEMMCQLRPLVLNLGLTKTLCFTLVKSRFKKI
jgi:hypothetical protein